VKVIHDAKLRNSVPTANLRTVLEIVTERGLAEEKVLEGSGLTVAMLDDTERRVPARQAAQVVSNAYLLTRDPGLGLEFGLRTKPTAHGPLGYAAMACGTLREALELVVRYMHLRQQDVNLRLFVEEGQVVLEVTDAHDMGPARRVIYEAMMIGLWHIAGFLLGEERPRCELWFDWPEPKYYAAYRRRLPAVRYGMRSMQLRMDERYLNRKLVMAEPEAARRAVAECEREMALLGGGPQQLKERVRAELHAGPDGYLGLPAVAARLFMSERTLKRRLEALGTSFRALLDGVRYDDARRMLKNPDLDIQQIAVALGYTDPPSFTRAFRRWSGQTPSEARARVRRR
jgi:AraC-like DNA-binding protein